MKNELLVQNIEYGLCDRALLGRGRKNIFDSQGLNAECPLGSDLIGSGCKHSYTGSREDQRCQHTVAGCFRDIISNQMRLREGKCWRELSQLGSVTLLTRSAWFLYLLCFHCHLSTDLIHFLQYIRFLTFHLPSAPYPMARTSASPVLTQCQLLK